MNDVIDAAEVESPFVGTGNADIDVYLNVESGGQHPKFQAKKPYDPDLFSESEMIALEHVFGEFGHKSAGQLVELTHLDPTWTIPNEDRIPGGRAPIPYQLFFEDADATTRQIWGLIEAEQEDFCSDEELDPELALALHAD